MQGEVRSSCTVVGAVAEIQSLCGLDFEPMYMRGGDRVQRRPCTVFDYFDFANVTKYGGGSLFATTTGRVYTDLTDAKLACYLLLLHLYYQRDDGLHSVGRSCIGLTNIISIVTTIDVAHR